MIVEPNVNSVAACVALLFVATSPNAETSLTPAEEKLEPPFAHGRGGASIDVKASS
jgi:hypothetical protein